MNGILNQENGIKFKIEEVVDIILKISEEAAKIKTVCGVCVTFEKQKPHPSVKRGRLKIIFNTINTNPGEYEESRKLNKIVFGEKCWNARYFAPKNIEFMIYHKWIEKKNIKDESYWNNNDIIKQTAAHGVVTYDRTGKIKKAIKKIQKDIKKMNEATHWMANNPGFDGYETNILLEHYIPLIKEEQKKHIK